MSVTPVPPLLALHLLLLSVSFISATSTTSPHGSKQISAQESVGMDPLEVETLFKVMEAVSSDRDWRASRPDPCRPGSSWPGLECKPGGDGHFHATRLDFGSPPNPRCKKNATFPCEVFGLPYLQSLFFFNCFESAKTTLIIPPRDQGLAAAASLRQLSLRSNRALVGFIPPHISSLSSLQVLTLSQNRLDGKIPDSISGLTSLVHLDLSYNSLTGSIPSQMGGMRSLVDLDLSYNSLSGPIPSTVGKLGLLQKLDLSSNSLTGTIPESLGSLNMLSFLALSSNKLNGRFPKGLSKLRNLQYFIMDDNPMFISLPFQLGRLAKLQELRLANSGYTGSIPGSFAWLKNLTTLSLENNRLTGEIPAGLNGLSRIYHLNLSRNMLGGVVPFNADFLRRLGRNLDLSGNPGLCVDGSENSEGTKAGVRVCGANGTATAMQQPLSSGGAPSLPKSFPRLLLTFIGLFSLHFYLIFFV